MRRSWISQCLIAALLAMTFIHPAMAAGDVKSPRLVLDSDAMLGAMAPFSNIEGPRADTFFTLAVRSKAFWSAHESLAERVGTSFVLQPAKAWVMEGEGRIGVFVPILGGAGFSTLQIWTDSLSGEVIGTTTMLFDTVAEGIRGLIEVDGELRMDAVVSDAGELVSGFVIDELGQVKNLLDFEIVRYGSGWNCFVNCMSGFGIPNAVMVLIGIGCGALCAATLGTGCALCIIALGLGFGFETGICRSRCGG